MMGEGLKTTVMNTRQCLSARSIQTGGIARVRQRRRPIRIDAMEQRSKNIPPFLNACADQL